MPATFHSEKATDFTATRKEGKGSMRTFLPLMGDFTWDVPRSLGNAEHAKFRARNLTANGTRGTPENGKDPYHFGTRQSIDGRAKTLPGMLPCAKCK